jgi:hypothetical protein
LAPVDATAAMLTKNNIQAKDNAAMDIGDI